MFPGVRRDALVDEVKKYLVQINEPIVPPPPQPTHDNASPLHPTNGNTNSYNEKITVSKNVGGNDNLSQTQKTDLPPPVR
jgi:hypothetical protein